MTTSITNTYTIAADKVDTAVSHARHDNWDGQGSNQACDSAASITKEFISKLPIDLMNFVASIDEDGATILEWAEGSRWLMLTFYSQIGWGRSTVVYRYSGEDFQAGELEYADTGTYNKLTTMVRNVIR